MPLYCVVPRPHFGQCLNDPTHVCTESFQLNHTVCTSLTVSLPGACLWPLCINVKLSLSLVYCCHYFIIILLILLFSIIFGYYFASYYVYFFCHSVVSLCSVLFLVVLCIYSCYHLYSVLPYNLCCSLKGFLNMEEEKKKTRQKKKNKEGLSRSDYVLLYFMWICKMVTKMLIFDCERFKMGKNKRLLNLSMSFVNICLIKMPDESDTNTHTHTQIHLPFSHGRPTRCFTAQTTTYQSASTAQCEQTQPKKLHQFTKSSLMLPTGRV